MEMLFLFVFSLAMLDWTLSDSCPDEKKRFSLTPTVCHQPRPICKLKVKGEISGEEKMEILNAHNRLRSIVASGKESAAGGMPPASNMMHMEWDDELAEIAQRWAESCEFTHDCRLCRQVENFAVGQNIAVKDFQCNTGGCSFIDHPADWNEVVQTFYNGIGHYNKNRVQHFANDTKTDRLTQIIWANTWRVGCGFAAYEDRHDMRHFYVCNYGPRGNVQKRVVYKEGKPCSGCPSNACCGTRCKGVGSSYEGLCRMRFRNTAPVYPELVRGLSFNCNFDDLNDNCFAKYEGKNVWNTKRTLSGFIKKIRLGGGEKSFMKFQRVIQPRSNFCVRVQYRKTPAVARSGGSSILKILVEEVGGSKTVIDVKNSVNFIRTYSRDFKPMKKVKLSIGFVVPRGSPDHILDVKDVTLFNGDCSSRKTDQVLGYQK